MSIFAQQHEDDAVVTDVELWFYAAFDSDCGECVSDIYEGDRVRYVDGVVVCEECGEQ